MRLTFEDKQKRVIKDREEIEFSSFSSYHLIVITARARSEKQISENATDDEELIVKIDGKAFPKLGSQKALLDSPASFNGGQLHNLLKTIYFLTFLKGREHTIVLETDKPPYNTATLEELEVYTLNLDSIISLDINRQAEDGDRRDWLTFVLDNLPLRVLTLTVTYSRRKWDSDDVKIIVDGKTQGNLLRNIKHFLWRYAGSLIPRFSLKTETEAFIVDLPQSLHYIEFHADRMPVLHKLLINFGREPQPPIRIPTVEDPKWTGDFYDDPEDILLARLILGEAENEPEEAKIWIAGAVLNRVEANAWPNTVHGVILQPDQYDPLKTNDPNFDKITDPLPENASVKRKSEWQESFEVARGVLFGKIKNPTEATHFHGQGVSKRWFLDNIVPNGRFITQIGNTYFYWSPN